MILKNTIQDSYAIIPEQQRKSFRKLLYGSFFFSLLDVISIGYLIPAVLLLLDRNKIATYFKEYNIKIDMLQPKTLIISIVLLVVLYVIKNLLQARFNRKLYHFFYNLSHELSMEMLGSYLHGDYLAFQQHNKGKLMQDITTATRDFATILLPSGILLFAESFMLIIVLAGLFVFYFALTSIAVIGITAFALLIYKVKRKEMAMINSTYKEAAAQSNAELLNILDGYLDIKNSGNHDAFLDRFKTSNQSLHKVTGLLTTSSANYQKYLELFLIMGIAGLIFFNYFVSGNTDNLVLISVLGALSIRIVPSIGKILNAVTMVNSHLYAIGILKKFHKTKNKATVHHVFEKSLAFQNISFKYQEDIPIFKNLNFTVEKGKITAIKGATGSGKTTFLHLVAGLLPPESGKIFLDGNAIKKAHFFSFVGYVPQQPFLFGGSLIDNITMRQKPEKIDYAYIDFLIENLELKALFGQFPDGLQTIVAHNSSKLSGGQKQRLALLRALYHKPRLLILDEATNQQNETLEVKIYNCIKTIVAQQGMTVLAVSHNPRVGIFCDSVFSLEQHNLSQST